MGEVILQDGFGHVTGMNEDNFVKTAKSRLKGISWGNQQLTEPIEDEHWR